MIEKYKIKISNIDIIQNFFILLSNENELYYSNIIKKQYTKFINKNIQLATDVIIDI
jgi:hypothetical protein